MIYEVALINLCRKASDPIIIDLIVGRLSGSKAMESSGNQIGDTYQLPRQGPGPKDSIVEP
jgi:hypothetical protein